MLYLNILKHLSKADWLAAAAIAVFAFWKLSSLHFRFGDENVYFYMTRAIGDGILPYRDFFIADPPFFILIISAYKWLIGHHYILFKAWPVIFDCANAVLIYIFLKAKNCKLAFLGPIFYLFSFTVLSTSDYVTGAETTIFFMLAALYADSKNKPYFTGTFWALSCLCKLYAAPALIGFLAYKMYAKEFVHLRKIIIAGIVTTAVVLAPFAIIAPHGLYYDLILHQFNRPIGLNKWDVWGFFAQMEWPLIIAGFAGSFAAKQKTLMVSAVLTAIFFMLYRDLYYLYLHILMPLLVILAIEALSWLKERAGGEMLGAALALYVLVSLYPVSSYAARFASGSIFSNTEPVAAALRDAPEPYPVYGIQEVAPLAALIADKPVFDNIIDTNTQNFAAGTHDRDTISLKAVENGIYLITHEDNLLYFDQDLFDRYCTLYKSFDLDIKIYACHKSSS